MHILSMIGQALVDTAGKLTLEHVSTGLLLMQQIQLSQMKVKVNALWDKFLGKKPEKEDAEFDETLGG